MGRLQHAIDRPVPFFGARIDITPPILLGIHLGAVTLVTLFLAPLRASKTARWARHRSRYGSDPVVNADGPSCQNILATTSGV